MIPRPGVRYPGHLHADWRPDLRGPNGRRLCRGCLAEVPKGRQTWCGSACVDRHNQASSGEWLRRRIFERDRGVCALCSVDAVALVTEVHPRDGAVCRMRYNVSGSNEALRACGCRQCERALELRDLGFPRCPRRSWWEVDHILPIVEGGDSAFENLRTLCVPCHRRETKLLAGMRAARRRALKASPDGLFGTPE